jgi:energy-coupling factor transporter ATP-binding protein EcfA2
VRVEAVSVNLEQLISEFRCYLFLPDPGPLEVVLGAVAANLLPGDPVWLLLVGPPASGKTEILSSLSGLPFIHEVSTFTEAGLLSGSVSRREGATGGLLAELGKFGIVVCKDFTSVLSESPDTRSALLAALREIYDGRWVRRLGSEGGRTLGWVGKVGVLAGVTETIDRHTAVMGAMGERFVLCRMPTLDDEGRLSQGRAAMGNVGHQDVMREELSAAVTAFVAGLKIPSQPPELPEPEREALVLLTDLATRCRSAVERDGRDREVELVPQAELPGRLQATLAQLMCGLRLIGVPNEVVGRLVQRVALDSMSKARRAIVELLVQAPPGTQHAAYSIGAHVRLPTGVASRALEDLASHGVVVRSSDRQGAIWSASPWLRERWQALGLSKEVAGGDS